MNLIKKILPLVLAVCLLCGSCVSVSAAENEYDLSQFELREYVIVVDLTNSAFVRNCVITSNKPLYVNESDNNNLTIPSGTYAFIYYKYSHGFSEVSSDYLTNVVNNSFGTLDSDSIEILYSNYDVENENGNIFFQVPVMPLVTEMRALPEVIRSQMEVILPIAVCCLALLVGLTALLRKLPIFLH